MKTIYVVGKELNTHFHNFIYYEHKEDAVNKLKDIADSYKKSEINLNEEGTNLLIIIDNRLENWKVKEIELM